MKNKIKIAVLLSLTLLITPPANANERMTFENYYGDPIRNAIFENLTAPDGENGGAIYANNSWLTIVDSDFIGNSAPNGGAIYANGGQLFIQAENKDVLFENNNSTGAQGGTGTGIVATNYLGLMAAEGRVLKIKDIINNTGAMHINQGVTGTIDLSNKIFANQVMLHGGTLKLSGNAFSETIPTLKILSDTTLDFQNGNAGDVFTIGELNGELTSQINFNVDYDGITGKMDRINIDSFSRYPKIQLNSINILNDVAAAGTSSARYLVGPNTGDATVRNDTLTIATSGGYKYTFTPDTSANPGSLHILSAVSTNGLPNYIQNASLGIDKFDITTDNFKVFDGNTHTALGKLGKERRVFTISGGSGSELDKTIDGILADSTKGEGIKVLDTQTLNLQNISDFKNFKNAVVSNGGTINIDNVTFSNNEGVNNGGVIDIVKTNENTIDNSTFSNNKSNINGGVIKINNAKIKINKTTFSGNIAGNNSGGAIYSEDSTLTLTDTNFTGNKAQKGAAIYSSRGDVIISAINEDVLFEKNNKYGIENGNGTGIEVINGNLTLNAGSSKTITIKDIISVSGGAVSANPLANLYINTNGSGTVYLANTFSAAKTNLNGGTLKLGETAAKSTISDLIINNTTTLDLGNNHANDNLTIDKLTIADGKQLDLILDFNADNSSMNSNIDKLTINSVDSTAGAPTVYLKDINIIKDGESATQAKYIKGIDASNLNLRSDSLSSIATSGNYVYTFTPQTDDKSILDVSRVLSPDISLPLLIQDKSKGIDKFDITTDNFKAFEGNTYTALGALDGNSRIFTISGGNGTDNKTISGLLSNNQYGDGVSLTHGQALNIKNISEFKNFNNAITNNNAIVDITNVNFSDNTGYDIKNYNDGILNFSGTNSVNTGIVGADGKMTLNNDATLDVNDIGIEQKYVTLKDGAKLNFNAKNNDITIKDISGGIHLNSSDNNNKTANLVLNADEGRIINLESEVTTNKTGTYNLANKLDNMVDLNGSGKINLKGNLNQVTMNVNGSDIERVSGTDTNVDWHLNNGGYLYYGNDNLLTDQSNLFFNGGSLDLRNGVASAINSAVQINSNSNLYLDVDLANAQMDRFDGNVGNINGVLNIAGLNLLSDTDRDYTSINFTTDENLKRNVVYSGGRQLQGRSPLYKYNVTYRPNSGNFEFTSPSYVNPYELYNPNIFGSSVAMQGAYLTQLANYDIALGNIDHNLLMTRAQKMAWKYGNKLASNEVNPQVYSPLYIPQENAGIWYRPYTTFENIRLDNGPKVSNVMYGSLVGGDSDLIQLRNGWSSQYSAFIGYNGSHQAYDGVGIYQNGGSLGATAAFFKGNFFEALTANVGASVANISTNVGDNDLTMLMTGVASKTGYNWELADGKFIIQPSWMMSYTFVNPMNDYTLGNGIRIKNSNLNSIQLSPSLKLIGNLKNGWQPYVSFRMMWNIIDDTKVQAAYVNLPQTTVKPYCEYGVGVQKTWGERFTGFGQTMIRNGGRNGVALSFGFRFAIGKTK